MRKSIAGALAEGAAKRREETQGRPSKTGGKLPPVSKPPKTRDAAAEGTGYSGRTLDKVDEVVALADSPDTPKPVKDVAREALASMDKSGRVDGAHQLRMPSGRQSAPRGAVLPAQRNQSARAASSSDSLPTP